MKFRAFCIAAVAAAFASAPLSAQENSGEEVEFEVKGETFVLQIPEGYCAPEGSGALIAKQFADADSANLTPVNLQRCGSYGEDYIMIKTPRQMPAVPIAKSIFIEIMANEMQKGQSVKEGLDQGKRDVDTVTDGKLDMDLGGIGYAGSDDQCAYLAGVADVAVEGGGAGTVAVGSCGTLVGTRHFFVHAYMAEGDASTIDELKARSRAVSLQITRK
ncbi:hypothetical protein ACI5KX_06410 [Erythrobacter sp. GH1-10]|uniref:hypothetical protein n=1 Tax=Erythrobacter sp. GH1-10 TaxID=3349334 RepID=UPI0038778F6F